jgi:hypothetical protein
MFEPGTVLEPVTVVGTVADSIIKSDIPPATEGAGMGVDPVDAETVV